MRNYFRVSALVCAVALMLPFGQARASSQLGIPGEVTPFLSYPASMRPLPAHPRQSLIDAVRTLSELVGFKQDVASKIIAARLDDELAGRLANLSLSALACARITAHAMKRTSVGSIVAALNGDVRAIDAAQFKGVRPCAADLWAATGDLERSIRSGRARAEAPSGIDIWPVLRVETGNGHEFYKHDYMILVDFGGSDIYMNNAGSNVVDLKHGPPGPVAPMQTDFANGCETALSGLSTGDCLPSVGVLLAMDGGNQFGYKQSAEPDFDGLCTNDPVIRRQVTGGVGFAGVGILRVAQGGNTFLGKTGTMGAGHIFGVGLLSAAGGHDSFDVIRNGEGFALIGGLGILDEKGPDNTYDYYMPAPIDPGAVNQTNGAGGVMSDILQCDNRPRFTLGAANLYGTGVLIDEQGGSTFRGGYSDDFIAALGIGRGGTMGFGFNNGYGVFFNGGGADTYAIDNVHGSQGLPARGEGVTIPPGSQSTGSYGVFIDR